MLKTSSDSISDQHSGAESMTNCKKEVLDSTAQPVNNGLVFSQGPHGKQEEKALSQPEKIWQRKKRRRNQYNKHRHKLGLSFWDNVCL